MGTKWLEENKTDFGQFSKMILENGSINFQNYLKVAPFFEKSRRKCIFLGILLVFKVSLKAPIMEKIMRPRQF